MRVSVYLPNWTNGLAWGELPSWSELVATARRLDEMGVDGIWVADQMRQAFAEHPSMEFWEAFTLLGAIAASTRQAEIGPLVASAGFRNPALMARMAITLHEISGGRAVIGLGAGYDEAEHRAYGFGWEHRIDRFEEAAAIVHDLLSSGASSREGNVYRTAGAVLPLPASRPPLILGTLSTGPRAMRTVAQHADGWAAWLAFEEATPGKAAARMEALSRACQSAGRDPRSVHRIVGLAVRLSDQPMAFGPWDLSAIAVRGTPREIATDLARYRTVADEIAVYAFPLHAGALDTLGAVLEELKAIG